MLIDSRNLAKGTYKQQVVVLQKGVDVLDRLHVNGMCRDQIDDNTQH